DLTPNTAEAVDISATLAAMVSPPAHCPGCRAESGQPWPEGATSRTCPRCISRMRRVWQVQKWNADPAHQSVAGHASWTAFSARWRASGGLAPLSAEAARRYVPPDMIRGPCSLFLPERLQATIYRAWCAGLLLHVTAWCSDEPPPDPDGLWVDRLPA